MTSQGNVCRLCAEICQDYKSFYDESGNTNEVQQLMMQYFDENLLHTVTGNNSNVMCIKCWHTISDFNSFQKSIYRAQSILRIKDEEIDLISEEEFLPEDPISSSNCEQSTDCNILAQKKATLTTCDTETVNVSSDDDISDTADNDGEFVNESSSSELLVETPLIAECNEAPKVKDRPTKSITQTVRLRKKLNIEASDDIIAHWAPVLKCMFCTVKCPTFSLLQRHFQEKHPLLKCQVKCCSKNFSRRTSYEDHIRLHIDSTSFACTHCDKKEKCRSSLAHHILARHSVPTDATRNPRNDSNTASLSLAKITGISTKSIPEKIGDSKSRRTKYVKKSNDFIIQMKPTLNCYLCPEKFTKFTPFWKHFSKSHRGEAIYITCCQRKWTMRCQILEHLQLHANPDIFKCNLCDVRYSREYLLKLHMRKHQTNKIKNCYTVQNL